MNESVLIVGAGSGLSASLARLCASKDMKVVLAARNIEKFQIKYCFKKLLVCFISKRSSLVSSYPTKSYTKIIVESVQV